jgi:DNA mismatch repair protein MutS2
MLFPQNIEDKLGFDKIRNIVSTECKTKSGQRALEKLHFSTDQDYLSSERKKFTEMASLMSEDLPFPMIAFEDVTALLQQAKVEGIQLAEADFFEIRKIMLTSREIVSFFKKYGSETYGSIFNLADELFADEHFTKELVRIIDETGKVSDFASPELKQIRKSLSNLKNGVRQRLEDMLRHNHKEGITDEQHQITVRDGRLVIPVKAEYKRQLKSIIHDESASGQTAFVEPIEVVENNNRIRELELDEKREIIRLLMHLAEMLRHNLDEVIRNVEVLGEFDLIQAKLRFAGRIEGNLPLISKDKKLVLRNAFHPILMLNNALSGKTIVPFSIELDNEKRILLVSGPNAGGKSVALKALGLLQYMFQCGLPVPVSDGSSMPVFKNLFADIGDEQSIENELSTYSSHLSAMRFMLLNSDADTLVMLDEFGTGTDPKYGGAIAQAVLEQLNAKQVFGMVNTHFSNLKKMADETAGMMNGCMLFDEKTLSPTYQLQVGVPGNSYALEVAQKIGLPLPIIQKTKELLGDDFIQFESISKNLKAELEIYRKKNRELEEKNTRLAQLTTQYTELKAEMEKGRKAILNQAKTEATRLLDESNKKIESTIRQIKESGAEKEMTKLVRNELEDFKQTIKPEKPKVQPKPIDKSKADTPLKVGDFVHLDGSESSAEILAIKGNEAEISIGHLKSFVKISRLQKATKKSQAAASQSSYNSQNLDLVEKRISMGYQIDIRGMRAEEVMSKMDNVMDQALLVGQNELRIVHGKGNGVLRKVVREHLKTYNEVHTMEDEHADRGGDGVTIVRLR